MKPILFNMEMVRAIVENRKTTTRRLVKPQPNGYFERKFRTGEVTEEDLRKSFKPPYEAGDVLYVRETWQFIPCIYCDKESCSMKPVPYEDAEMVSEGCYVYREDYPQVDRLYWRPSIHMPKVAARIFLQVDSVKMERLQEITPEGCIMEGVEPEAMEAGGEFARGMFHDIWDGTVKKQEIGTYGWDANPWVWVIQYHRIAKAAGRQHFLERRI